jgi:hypothetical protein
MWTVSSSWDEAIRNTHQVSLRVDAWRNGVLVAADLPVEPDSGSITVDSTSDVHRTIDLTIADPAMVPLAVTDILTPHGTELVVTSGIRYPDGTIEQLPVGVFRIDKPSTPILGAIHLTGVDRSRVIADDKFINTAQSVAGHTVTTEIARLIAYSLPTATVRDLSADTTLCPFTTWEQDSSPWAAITELALSIGAEVFADAEGVFVIRVVPTFATGHDVWTVNIGQSGVIIAGTEEWDREQVFNAVTAAGEPGDGTGAVQDTVFDLDEASPTFWGGPFGHRPKRWTSPLLASVAQCTVAATTILTRSLASTRTVKVTVVPNPALECGDVVSLVLPGVTESDPPRVERHMIRAITLPLGLGSMELDLFTAATGYARPDPVAPADSHHYPATYLYPTAILYPL